MSTPSPSRSATRRRRGKRRPRHRWIWITLSVFLLLVVVGVVGAVMAYQTFQKAETVRAKLTTAIPLVGQVKDQLTSFDTAGATATAAQLGTVTADARAETDDFVWRVMEIVPVLGPNLSAVRAATEVADDISTDIVTPLSSTSLDQLKPVDSRIDLAAFTDLAAKITVAKTTIDASEARISGIDRSALLPQVSDAIDEIQPQLQAATVAMDAIEPVTSILPDSLGASGPRNYLVLFQNLAEAQALGGGAAALMMLHVEDGTIEIAAQADSGNFKRKLTPGVTVDQSALDTFGGNISFDLNTATVRPDFPTAASIATQFWTRTYPDKAVPDGVLAVDPKALSYLIGATGDITLPDGTVLTADNTVKSLLHDPYFRFAGDDVADLTDAFFEGAAATIFNTILSGSIEPSKMLPAIVKGVDESRILAYSSDADEQALLAPTPIAGILPKDNTASTTTGVYFQDASVGSKMDYYLTTDVKQSSANLCAATGATTATAVTLNNTISESDAEDLPAYVAAGGRGIPKGDFITNVFVYGPPGTTFTGVSWGSQTTGSTDLGASDDLGRPVARVAVVLGPGETANFTAAFTAAAGSTFSAAAVATTPMLNPTTVAVEPDASCPAG
ncbi:DUF4012 domain-containing protein [Microbacteriaceae bacterium VKM Ac-2854]|nr:DUF4012 domain-containing protein [Microbacteriaceae bacterium VKM Ac-2854]